MNTIFKLTRLTCRIKISTFPQITRVQGYRRSFLCIQRELKLRQLRYPNKVDPRNTFPEWNYDAELYAFGQRLHETFNDDLLRQALTERSYVLKLEEEQKQVGIEPSDEKYDNSEMVSDGEQFLNNIIPLYLRHVLPRYPEEGIQAVKNFLIGDEVLSNISSHIGTSDIVLCSEFPIENKTLVSVFKALISAVKESSGSDRALLFVRDFVITQLAQMDINDLWTIENPISALNTICHNSGESEPEPRLVGDAGKNTIMACFRVGLYLNEKLIGLSPGETVEIAYEMAANDALWRLFGTAEHQLILPFDLVLDPNNKSEQNVSLKEWSEDKVQERLKRIGSTVQQQVAQN